MTDLWYRGTDPVDHTLAAGLRLSRSAGYGLEQAPGAAGARLRELLDWDSLWVLGLALGAWVVATFVSGPVGIAVDAALLALGVLAVGQELVQYVGALGEWAQRAYSARNEQELVDAGAYFGAVMGGLPITVVEGVLAGAQWRALRAKVLARYPRPLPRPPAEPIPPGPQSRPPVAPESPLQSVPPPEPAPRPQSRPPAAEPAPRPQSRPQRPPTPVEPPPNVGAALGRIPGALAAGRAGASLLPAIGVGVGALATLALVGGLAYASAKRKRR